MNFKEGTIVEIGGQLYFVLEVSYSLSTYDMSVPPNQVVLRRVADDK